MHRETQVDIRTKTAYNHDDNNGDAQILYLQRMFGVRAHLKMSPVSFNLGGKFLRRGHLKKHGPDVTRGRNSHVLRQRFSIETGTVRNIHISHISRNNGRSRIFINTSFGNGKKDHWTNFKRRSAATWSISSDECVCKHYSFELRRKQTQHRH